MVGQVDVIIADFDLFTTQEVIALALNVNANLRENPPIGTPFDTGWASANWVPSVGEPSTIDGTPPRDGPTPSEVAARAQVSSRGVNDVLGWTLDRGPIFSTNNVPYIEPLNNGHSPQQAAPGFVQRGIEQAIRETYSAGVSKAQRLRRSSAVAGETTRSTAFGRARRAGRAG